MNVQAQTKKTKKEKNQMTKISVLFADEVASSIIVHTNLAYEVQPVHTPKIHE